MWRLIICGLMSVLAIGCGGEAQNPPVKKPVVRRAKARKQSPANETADQPMSAEEGVQAELPAFDPSTKSDESPLPEGALSESKSSPSADGKLVPETAEQRAAIRKEAAQVKLVPLEFKMAGLELLIDAPPGAVLVGADDTVQDITDIRGGEHYQMRIELTSQPPSDSVYSSPPPAYKGAVLRSDPDLIVHYAVKPSQNQAGEVIDAKTYTVIAARKNVGFQDFLLTGDQPPSVVGPPISRLDAEVMLRSAESLRLKASLPDDPVAIVKQFRPMLRVYKEAGRYQEEWKQIDGDTAQPIAPDAVWGVDFGYGETTNSSLLLLPRMPELRYFSWHVKKCGAELAPLTEVRKLWQLRLSTEKLQKEGLPIIGKLHGLHYLDIGGGAIDGDISEALKSLVNLENLRLASNSLDDAALPMLSSFTQLQVLSLSSEKLTGTGLKSLKEATKLQELRLGGSGITDAGLLELPVLASLTELNLEDAKITNESASRLAMFTGLKELTISGTGVDDKAIEQLGKLQQLESLNVSKTRITPDGVKRLKSLLAADCTVDAYDLIP
ncbi:MAG: F-box/LRR-repeat protein 14-like [Planctomycetaceae bacterium]|nr:F-box/LRR-repeat protein 14-like [Planctomycetaceae bacterium]